MNKFYLAFCPLCLFVACKSYDNKERYTLAVGETVEIYYSTNSCCSYCLAKEKEFAHVLVQETKIIDPGPEHCDGCHYTAAFVFKAQSPGIDTVALKLVGPDGDCDSNDVEPETYIIEVINKP